MATDEHANMAIGSVEEFLLALADGIHLAQRKLSQRSIALQPGQPAITYQLPKVEFEFRTTFEFDASEATLRMRPASSGADARSTSMIKGSFVAVPAAGGKPPPLVKLALERVAADTLSISAIVTTADGQPIEGVPVEFNIDRTQSSPGLQAGTQIWDGVLTTHADGGVATTLRVDPAEVQGRLVVIKIDTLSETQTVIFKVEAD